MLYTYVRVMHVVDIRIHSTQFKEISGIPIGANNLFIDWKLLY